VSTSASTKLTRDTYDETPTESRDASVARRNDERMNVVPLGIPGALQLTPQVYTDQRGYFKEVFSAPRYAAAGITQPFVQDNVSRSARGVVRGLHGDPRMSKLVQVLVGRAYDVIVDVRPDSPAFLRWVGVTLDAGEHAQVYIPAGCLHGFLALDENTLLSYKQTHAYDPAFDRGIAWDDPDLAIEWPLAGARPLLSAKDAQNPTLRTAGLL
jgi:dTDP-4-dehydrorhamnose 3,5-epimerase